MDIVHPQLGRLVVDDSPPRLGGQSEVRRARLADGRGVAIKLSGPSPAAASAVAREARHLGEIHRLDKDAGAWLVPYLGSGQTAQGRRYLVLQWFPLDLARWLEAHEGDLATVLRALERACMAVHRLHRVRVDPGSVCVHRDLKASNFLVDDGRGIQVRLADLGNSKVASALATQTRTGAFTPGHAPPERLIPVDAPPHPATDIFSLSVMVYSALARFLPTHATRLQRYVLPLGDRLLALLSRPQLTELESLELSNLRTTPLHLLFDFEEAGGLCVADEHRLLAQVAAAADADPDAVARACRPLLDVLRHGLVPDPAQRLASAGPLVRALRVLAANLGTPLDLQSSVGPPPPPMPMARPAGAFRWFAAGALCSLAGVGLVWGLLPPGSGGLPWLGSKAVGELDGLIPATANAPGVEPIVTEDPRALPESAPPHGARSAEDEAPIGLSPPTSAVSPVSPPRTPDVGGRPAGAPSGPSPQVNQEAIEVPLRFKSTFDASANVLVDGTPFNPRRNAGNLHLVVGTHTVRFQAGDQAVDTQVVITPADADRVRLEAAGQSVVVDPARGAVLDWVDARIVRIGPPD